MVSPAQLSREISLLVVNTVPDSGLGGMHLGGEVGHLKIDVK